MRPLDEGTPTADTVERVRKDMAAVQFQDQPLGVIKENLKSARTDRDDVQRYGAQ